MLANMGLINAESQKIADIWKNETAPNIEATGVAVENLDDDLEGVVMKVEKMAAAEIVFLNDEQASRFDKMVKDMARIEAFFKQDAGVRQFLMLENFKESMSQAGADLKAVVEVDFMEPMWDVITDLGVGWNALFTGLEAGMSRVAGAVAQGMTEWFDRVFDGVNSLLEQFVVGVMEAIAAIATRLAAAAAIAAIFQLVSGGVFGFGQIFKALTGIGSMHTGGVVTRAHDGMKVNAPASREFPILVRGGETVRTESQETAMRGGGDRLAAKIDELIAAVMLQAQTPIVIQGAMDGQKFLKQNWPDYDRFRRKKEV